MELAIAGRSVSVLIRLVRVGRVPLLLLDTDLPETRPEDREITARLYGGDQETRIRQELVLGIGGLRALELSKFRPTIRHINEGHAAFVGLEKIRLLVSHGGLRVCRGARARRREQRLHDAHAGSRRDRPLSARAGREVPGSYVADAGLSWEEFLRLGQDGPPNPLQPFSMAVLALRLCGHANAVSQLHARVSRRLWLGLLPELADEDIRIQAITNGVHRVHLDRPRGREAAARGRSGRPFPRNGSGAFTSDSARRLVETGAPAAVERARESSGESRRAHRRGLPGARSRRR